MRIVNLFLNKLDHLLFWIALHQFEPVETLMDIGCGNNPQKFIEVYRRHITVDPAFSKLPGMYFHINGTWQNAGMDYLKNHWVDTVVLMDVVEHLEKKEAVRLLKETQKHIKQIVVFTPLGFMEQDDKENHWNCHKSAWYPQDFPGWRVEVFEHFHWCDFKGRELPEPNGAILAVWKSEQKQQVKL